MFELVHPIYMPLVKRLSTLSSLDRAAKEALSDCAGSHVTFRPEQKISLLSQSDHPVLILQGWAARSCTFENGGRQLVDLAISGDVVFPRDHQSLPLVALSSCRVCIAPNPEHHPALQRAFNRSLQLSASYMTANALRVGSLNARDRLLDLFAELYERSLLAGLARGGRFATELTQRLLGDLTALTPVHVNRMLKGASTDSDVSWSNRTIVVREGSKLDLTARANVARLSDPTAYLQRSALPF